MSDTVRGAIVRVSRTLSEAGLEGAARDARALVAFATGLDPMMASLEGARELTPDQQAALSAAVAARLDHRPVSQIIGQRLFWGRSFAVTPDVLDPRPETETIIARALQLPPPGRVLDLGTGSGILALTLAAECANAEVVATDISAAALKVARANAEALGVSARVNFLQGDWFAPVSGTFDLIVSNPPYISAAEMQTLATGVLKWEPHGALSPGGDGLDAYRHLAAGLTPFLATGGTALFEFGAGQAGAVQAIFADAGLINQQLLPDMDGRARVLEVTAPAASNEI